MYVCAGVANTALLGKSLCIEVGEEQQEPRVQEGKALMAGVRATLRG